MTAVLKYFTTRLEILELNKRSGVAQDSEQFELLSDDAVTSTLRALGAVSSYNADVASKLLDMVLNAPLSDRHKEKLRTAFNRKIRDSWVQDPSIQGCAGAPKGFSCKYPEVFLRQKDWDKVTDKAINLNDKFTTLALVFVDLQLFPASECTVRDIAALALLNVEDESHIHGKHGLELVRLSKKIMNDVGQGRVFRLSSIGRNLPDSILEFKSADPEGYSIMYDGSPENEACGAPAGLLARIMRTRHLLPCRITRAGCSEAAGTGDLGDPNMQGMGGRAKEGGMLPRLEIFPQGTRTEHRSGPLRQRCL